MKKLLLFLLGCALAAQAAQAAPTWLTSLPEAQAKAKKENKLVLLDFTGSDWCYYCKKLDEAVLTKPEFDDYARKNLVLVEVDFPRSKEQSGALKAANSALQEKYKVDGYPTLVAMKPDGTVVWTQVGYGGDPASAIIAQLQKAGK